MFLKGYKHRDIQEVLEVSPGSLAKRLNSINYWYI